MPARFPAPSGVPTPITVTIPHALGRAAARRRIETGFVKLTQALPSRVGK